MQTARETLLKPNIVTLTYSADPAVQKRNIALIGRYYEVYKTVFTITEEVVPKSFYVEALTNPHFYPKIAVTLQGANLDEPENAKIAAFLHGEYYANSQSAFTAYVATMRDRYNIKDRSGKLTRLSSEQVRSANDQALMKLAHQEGKTILGKFSAINNPVKIASNDDIMDPWLRVNIMESWGRTIVPIDFVQPALSEGGKKCDILMLVSHPIPGVSHKAAPAQISTFLEDFMTALNAKNLDANPDYGRMQQQLESLRKGNTRPRTLSPAMCSFLDKNKAQSTTKGMMR